MLNFILKYYPPLMWFIVTVEAALRLKKNCMLSVWTFTVAPPAKAEEPEKPDTSADVGSAAVRS